MLRKFRITLGFLTILPVSPGPLDPQELYDAVYYFPIVGGLCGLVTWGALNLFYRIFSDGHIAAWFTVFLIALLNGFIHMDGLADTADGFGSAEPAKSLVIMKDSRLGTFGGAAICLFIVGKIFALSKLTACPFGFFMAASSLSRWVMAMQIYTLPSVSQGILKDFCVKGAKTGVFISSVLLVCMLVFSGWPGFLLWITGISAFIFLNKLIKWKFGGITGDILGASNELVELICYMVLVLI